jgi:serine/threonine-protein kinase
MPSALDRRPLPAMAHPAEVAAPRRDGRRAARMIGLALAVAAIAALSSFTPQRGEVAVNVADAKGSPIPHLTISIDGQKRCDAAPCVVPHLAAGSHTVKVEARGFEPPADRAVAVEAHKDTTVDFHLARMANAGTGIRVAGAQPGLQLFVDDREMGPLPQTLRDLAPGVHKVKVTGSDRYAPIEKTVAIAKDDLLDLGTFTLRVVKGKATPVLETPGARVFLVSGGDRWELPSLPVSVDIDTSKPWSLVASRPGFDDYAQPIRFDDGQAEKTFKVSMNAKTPTVPAVFAPAPVRAAASAPASDSADAPPASSEDEEASKGQAFLKINSIPSSSVVLDGKAIGNTPMVRYPVSPGAHSVVFTNPDQGFEKQISVTVAPGETKTAVARN